MKSDDTEEENAITEETSDSAFDLQLRKFRITDASISYTDMESGTVFSTGETESCPYGKTQRHADRLTMQGFDTGYFTFDG